MLDKPLSDDPRRDLGGVVLPLAAVEAQREREGVGEVFGFGGREAIGRGYGARLAPGQERELRRDDGALAFESKSVLRLSARAAVAREPAQARNVHRDRRP
jgi:hypothetical protein